MRQARPHHQHPRHAPRPGFTLAEVVVSISILSIVMTGLMSALLLSTKALPQDDDPGVVAPKADAALEMIMADAMFASIVNKDGSKLRLYLPDRDGDTKQEVVKYELDDPGHPPTSLLREYNGGAKRTVLTGVHGLTFTVSSVDGDRSSLVIELVTARNTVHRASIELLTRPEN